MDGLSPRTMVFMWNQKSTLTCLNFHPLVYGHISLPSCTYHQPWSFPKIHHYTTLTTCFLLSPWQSRFHLHKIVGLLSGLAGELLVVSWPRTNLKLNQEHASARQSQQLSQLLSPEPSTHSGILGTNKGQCVRSLPNKPMCTIDPSISSHNCPKTRSLVEPFILRQRMLNNTQRISYSNINFLHFGLSVITITCQKHIFEPKLNLIQKTIMQMQTLTPPDWSQRSHWNEWPVVWGAVRDLNQSLTSIIDLLKSCAGKWHTVINFVHRKKTKNNTMCLQCHDFECNSTVISLIPLFLFCL